jgi:5-methylthioribose kinase
MSVYPYFDENTQAKLQDYLREKNFIAPLEEISSLAKAGDGNMNATLKVVVSSGKSLVVKQSRPFVKKFPELDAPEDRILAEAAFYSLIQERHPQKESMPKLQALDEANRLAIIDFEEEAKDGSFLYAFGNDNSLAITADLEKSLITIAEWLAELHTINVDDQLQNTRLQNLEMAEFQRNQTLEVPFQKLMFQMKATLVPDTLYVEAWNAFRTSGFLAARNSLDTRFRRSTKTLLHGDFFPKNWLFLPNGKIKIIDPEFCFFGPAEYDLGVMIAHLHLAGIPPESIARIFTAYTTKNPAADGLLTDSFARFEIIRRIIGLAKLPIAENKADELLKNMVAFFSQ